MNPRPYASFSLSHASVRGVSVHRPCPQRRLPAVPGPAAGTPRPRGTPPGRAARGSMRPSWQIYKRGLKRFIFFLSLKIFTDLK